MGNAPLPVDQVPAIILAVHMKKTSSTPAVADMRPEYDFSRAVRGVHFRAYRAGHVVRVKQADGTVEERHFTLDDGAVMLDPDLRAKFPDSEAVNQALRKICACA